MQIYTLQQDAHNNLIVCKGETVRNGYQIIASGTYGAMLLRKVGHGKEPIIEVRA